MLKKSDPPQRDELVLGEDFRDEQNDNLANLAF